MKHPDNLPCMGWESLHRPRMLISVSFIREPQPCLPRSCVRKPLNYQTNLNGYKSLNPTGTQHSQSSVEVSDTTPRAVLQKGSKVKKPMTQSHFPWMLTDWIKLLVNHARMTILGISGLCVWLFLNYGLKPICWTRVWSVCQPGEHT